jgi:hypothetical protein
VKEEERKERKRNRKKQRKGKKKKRKRKGENKKREMNKLFVFINYNSQIIFTIILCDAPLLIGG